MANPVGAGGACGPDGAGATRGRSRALQRIWVSAIAIFVAMGMPGLAIAKEDVLPPEINKSTKNQALLLQADELIQDSKNDQILAKGNVEVYYKDYALTSDQLLHDQKANKLNAIGKVRIKQPDGAVVTTDRITLTNDFRDGFLNSFAAATKEEARIAATHAVRKDDNAACKPCEGTSEAAAAPIWRIKANARSTPCPSPC